MSRTFKLTLAYDGTRYAGWQLQPGQVTLQGTLEAAIVEPIGSAVRVAASGRTDAGVHALGQVVSFEAETELAADVLQRAINARLPPDMVVLELVDAEPGFHARIHALAKRYRYLLHDGAVRDVFVRHTMWRLHTRLDAERMHAAAQHWIGEHDFQSLQTAGSPRVSTVRTVTDVSVRRGWHDNSDVVVFEVEADGFLYNMVRAMAGTLVKVGDGSQPPQWAGEVLTRCDRSAAGMTAPAHGLFLVGVRYAAPSLARTGLTASDASRYP